MSLELKTNDPDFRTWTSRYKPTGRGIPMLFIVSADGRELYNRSGAPSGDGLRQLLLRGIEQTGGPKRVGAPGSSRKLATLVKKAQRLVQNGRYDSAITLLLPQLKQLEGAAGGTSPATKSATPDPRKQLAELVDELSKKARTQLDEVKQHLAESQDLLAAVSFLKAKRHFGELPEIKTALEGVSADIEKLPGEIQNQAELAEQALFHEETGNHRAALAAYERSLRDYSSTALADFAKTRIRALDLPRTWTDSSGDFRVVAKLVAHNENLVRLRKKDGTEIDVPVGKLSERDRNFLQSLK